MIIGDCVILGSGGESASIIVTAPVGSSVTMRKPDGKTIALTYKHMKNPDWRDLPNGYTQVEYLQSSGTQVINTGVNFTSAMKRVDVAEFVTLGGYSGVDKINSTDVNLDCYYGINQIGMYFFGLGNVEMQWLTADTKKHTFVLDALNRLIAVDDRVTQQAGLSFSFGDKLPLFAKTHTSDDNRYTDYASMKLYSCKLYRWDELVNDYVPCVNSSGVAGLYDLLTNTFLTNIGSGVFSVGHYVPEYLDIYSGKASQYGTYTLTATKDGQTATKTVAVDAATEYELTMSYDCTITISGHESVSYWSQYGIDAYVAHGGINHTDTFSIPAGDAITLKVTYINTSTQFFKIILNGVEVGSVASTTRSYTFTPTSDVDVVISLDMNGGYSPVLTLTATGGI